MGVCMYWFKVEHSRFVSLTLLEQGKIECQMAFTP